MTRSRAFALFPALVVLAGVAVWNDAWSTDHATSTPRARIAVVDQDTALVVPSVGAGEVRSAHPLGLPLTTLVAGIAGALLAAVRRDRQALGGAYPVRQRLVRASRRAPPTALLPSFA